MNFIGEEREHIEWYRVAPAKDARYARPKSRLNPEVISALRVVGNMEDFYVHQARALDALQAGRHVLLVTQTASGKTWCYNPAIFETLCATESDAHALYVFPLNALMMDQKQKIDDLCKHLNSAGRMVTAEVVQGGIGLERRKAIARQNPNILCVNPEMLSVILGEAGQRWERFFSRLRYVVFDEIHSYRGLFGLHMAGIMRRLVLASKRFGSSPQFILCSATVSNPRDLATRLTSLPASEFEVLDKSQDGSQQAFKHWIVYSPDGAANDDYDGYLASAAAVMVRLLTAKDTLGRPAPLNTILFARSMRDVEKAHKLVRENLQRQAPHLANKVRQFIGARLEPAEKREIYEGLRDERYVGVVSTNALEAGIDIGKLDACVIAGFPYSIMRMRQMAGRVGRQNEGLVVYVPHPVRPVDEYYRHNPELLLTQDSEAFVVDADNPYIARKHLNAAAMELKGIGLDEAAIFGPRLDEMVTEAVGARAMTKFNGRLFGTRRSWTDASDIYAVTNIRSAAQIPYVICRDSDQQCPAGGACSAGQNDRDRCPRQVGVVDQQYVYRDYHPGAMREELDGRLYRITRIDDRGQVVGATELTEGTLERTFVDESVTIELLGDPKGSKQLPGGASMAWGRAKITRSYYGYYKYQLIPQKRCKTCRRQYEKDTERCPQCGRLTQTVFGQSQPKYHDFPSPYAESGFHLTLDTIAAWLMAPATMEEKLYRASPCKLPGEKNAVQAFLRRPLDVERGNRPLAALERGALAKYHEEAGKALRQAKRVADQTLVYPGIYGQCLLASLRQTLPEGEALRLFERATSYPATSDLRHVCRNCVTSTLLPAMHTLEHTVAMRYPAVALGDQTDLASHTSLGHPQTGGPTIFWFDNYEGGIGAAEKIYQRIGDLLEASWTTLDHCSCGTIEGCPYCTQLAQCDRQNEGLSKPAALELIGLLLGRKVSVNYQPFTYSVKRKRQFDERYDSNEYVREDHGVGEEKPAGSREETLDPYEVLRLQRNVHAPVLERAFDVRGTEISEEVPPISVSVLEKAYRLACQDARPNGWQLTEQMPPYQVLEVTPAATSRMIGRVYRVIITQLHPDKNPDKIQWATQMTKIVVNAYGKLKGERGQ